MLGRARECGSDLIEVMLVMGRHLLEFVLQRSHAGNAVHELEVSFGLVVQLGVVDDGLSDRLIDSARKVERNAGIVEPFRPGVLIEDPQDLPGLAQDASNAIEENRFSVGEVQQDESDRPFPGRVRPREIVVAEREEREGLVAGCFQPLKEIRGRGESPNASHRNVRRGRGGSSYGTVGRHTMTASVTARDAEHALTPHSPVSHEVTDELVLVILREGAVHARCGSAVSQDENASRIASERDASNGDSKSRPCGRIGLPGTWRDSGGAAIDELSPRLLREITNQRVGR